MYAINGRHNSGTYTPQAQFQSVPLQLSDRYVFFKLLPTTTVKQDPSWMSNSYLLRQTTLENNDLFKIDCII